MVFTKDTFYESGKIFHCPSPGNLDHMLSRVEFHYTPKHASWLNIAEIEINVIDIECTDRQFNDYGDLKKQVTAWPRKRNQDKKKIKWTFDKEKADKKLSKYYTT